MLIALVVAALQSQDPRDLADLSLEELMRIEVTTASRKEQRLIDIPAAVTVIRGEDVRRSGARNLPEALRMAPGTFVSRIDGSKYAVSIRGFSDRFANKLQVLIDGRSVYSALFSGAFWDQENAFLEDIDRIEVIRGPGGAVWGANAVNGVINIITKSAKATRGGYAFAGAGTEERAFGGVRYGASSEGFHYRAYGQGFSRDEQHKGDDDMWEGRSGFRADWDASKDDLVTFIGEAYAGRTGTGTALAAPAPVYVDPRHQHNVGSGGHVVARWERRLSGDGRLSAQTSYTRMSFDNQAFGEMRDTVDVDVTHRFQPFEGHDLIWGLGYRWTRDETADSFPIRLDPEEEADDIASLFFQDEIELAEEVLKLTLGCRFEHNDYTGFEIQPSARLALRPHERHMVWAAVSRAVRTPSRTESDVRFVVSNTPGAPFDTQVHILGTHDFKSEELVAFELGYRVQPADALTIDTAVFLNLYDDLLSIEPAGTVSGPPANLVLQTFDNRYEARTYGAEAALTWEPAKGARFYGAYTFFKNNLIPRDSQNAGREGNERNDPKGQAYVRASLDLVDNVQIDLLGRYVGPLGNRNVEAYAEADIRLAWRPSPSLELSVVGQNLLHDEHFENTNSGLTETATEPERGVYFMADWRF